jgi:hypothetical protein
MKALIKIFSVFAGLLLITACAGGGIQIPQKYSLDGQLPEVLSFQRNIIMDWQSVDRQSLIVETSPGTYYLLVLRTPAPDLPFYYSIGLSAQGRTVRAGFDQVILFTPHIREMYRIDRIYEIKGKEQMLAIRSQLDG